MIKRYSDELNVSYIKETLGEEEYRVFNSYLNMLQEKDLLQLMHTEMILFLDLKGIPYVDMDGIIALVTGKTYYGFTLDPSIMGYTYEENNDDDTFVTISDEELTIWGTS